MRGVLTGLVAIAMAGPAMAVEASRPETVTVGPWQIEVGYAGKAFDRCVMSRTTEDGVLVRFVRNAGGLDLAMSSPKWKLGKGKTYLVELVAGTSAIKVGVEASGNAVSVPIRNEGFLRSLKGGNSLDVRGEGSTIRVGLQGSDVAFDRLDACFAKNSSPAQSNPFVAPSRKP